MLVADHVLCGCDLDAPRVPSIPMARIESARRRLRTLLARTTLDSVNSTQSSESTLAFVNDRLDGAQGLLSLAILGVEGAGSAIFALAGKPGWTAVLAHRLNATSLPLLRDYARLVRSLVIVSVYDAKLQVEDRNDCA
jgi:hypothetical protein